MLVYIRESDKEKIMCNVDEKDIAEHLRVRLELIWFGFWDVTFNKKKYFILSFRHV